MKPHAAGHPCTTGTVSSRGNYVPTMSPCALFFVHAVCFVLTCYQLLFFALQALDTGEDAKRVEAKHPLLTELCTRVSV